MTHKQRLKNNNCKITFFEIKCCQKKATKKYKLCRITKNKSVYFSISMLKPNNNHFILVFEINMVFRNT